MGIGETEANRLASFIQRFGETNAANGHFDPRLEDWMAHPGGTEAARDFRVAIRRDMDRSINTIGIGDTPALADHWLGRMLLQFTHFAFTFTNRYIQPMFQRGVHYQDIRAASSLATLMVTGALVTAIKDAMRGVDPTKRYDIKSPDDAYALGVELLDRTGLNGYLGPYISSANKLAGYAGASRYERQSWYENLAGINASLIGDVGRFAGAVSGYAHGDTKGDQVLKKLIALSPYASLLRMGQHLYEDR